MEVHNLVIISVILNKLILNGFNLMMKELDNLILMILKLIASEENIGEGKVKVLISLFMKKLRKLHFAFNLIIKNSDKN